MTPVTGRVRILIVDDDALVRAGLRLILSSAEDLTVIGEAADGATAVSQTTALRPDVVLMDVRMPTLNGIAATMSIRSLTPAPQVIVLTTFHLDQYVLDALRAGASGFLLKDTPPTEIVAAIRSVAGGEAAVSPAVTRTLIDHVRAGAEPTRRRGAQASLGRLSDRERQVAVEIASGLSNADVAARLHMSEATVKAHVSRVLTKLNATNRVQVAITVHDAGLA